MKKNLLILIICLCVSSLFSKEITDNSAAMAIEEGINYHNTAQNKEDKKIEKCLETLKPFIDSDPIARAYYGSAITISAGYCSETAPIKALELLEEGSRYIDEAITMDSSNLITHILRLENGLEVSKLSPYKRYSVIKSDVNFLLKDGILDDLDDSTKASVYYFCGLYRIEENDIDSALDLFDLSINAKSGSEFARLSQNMLNRYEE